MKSRAQRRCPIVACALSAVACIYAIVRADAADWPHLRGPNYDAVSSETGLADAWPAGGPPCLWSRDLGDGYSGIIVVENRVFTQFQDRTGQYVICLNAANGEQVWSERVDWPWQLGGAYPGPYATPTFCDGRVYYTTPAGAVGCLDAATGSRRWSLSLEKSLGEGTQFGFAATPLVEGNRMILPVGSKGASVMALDCRDGATRWSVGNDAASYTPAYAFDFNGQRVAVAYLRNAIMAVSTKSGELLWRQSLSAGYDEHAAWPIYRAPDLWVSAPFRSGCRLLELTDSDGAIAAKTVWSNRQMSNDICSSVLVDGHLYGFDLRQQQASAHRPSRGTFKCLDFLTGELCWETDVGGQATAVAADNKLYLLNESGTLILARVDATQFNELARVQVFDDGLCWTPPALSDGRLFVRNRSKIACYFVGPPETVPSGMRSTAHTVAAPNFFAASILTREPAHPYDPPTKDDLSRWFVWCLGGVFAPAAIVGLIAWKIARAFSSNAAKAWASSAFALTAFLLGLIGTTIYSAWADALVLTWPASLFIAFRSTLAVASKSSGRRQNWLARLGVVGFALVCYGYYRLCLLVGYAIAWTFLVGFVPAAPLAVMAERTRRRWLRLLLEVAAFVVYFWFSGAVPGWKARV
jgi:outer membrane protein assembly factor BamB